MSNTNGSNVFKWNNSRRTTVNQIKKRNLYQHLMGKSSYPNAAEALEQKGN
jgi:hypothetical protein